MENLQKISDITVKYEVTSRTLRYYEEIGLLFSKRLGNAQYRYYDEAAVSRIEQILFLRKLQLSINDIKNIYKDNDMQIFVAVFVKKLNTIHEDINALEILKCVIEDFLSILKNNGYAKADGLKLLMEKHETLENSLHRNNESKKIIKMEEFKMAIEKISKADFRVIHLNPIRQKTTWFTAMKYGLL